MDFTLLQLQNYGCLFFLFHSAPLFALREMDNHKMANKLTVNSNLEFVQHRFVLMKTELSSVYYAITEGYDMTALVLNLQVLNMYAQ